VRDLIEALCAADCAGRATGSPGGRRARAILARAFADVGLEVHEQPLPDVGGANLLAAVRGTGPNADRFVVVGAHYDHLGVLGGTIHPGADDNATAVAILIDLAGALARRRPQGRSVLLAAFDGEEPPHFAGDTMGSEQFCRAPTVPLAAIDTMVCMDLVGHAVGPIDAPEELRQSLFVLGAERGAGTPALVDRLARAVPGVLARRLDAEVIPPLSDYWPFWRRRVPFLFLTCGRWAHYHTPDDTPDRLDYAKIAATARWLELLVRQVCARPEERVAFADRRDDAATLHTLRALLAPLASAHPVAAEVRRRASELLASCDEHGVSRDPLAISALAMQVEAALF